MTFVHQLQLLSPFAAWEAVLLALRPGKVQAWWPWHGWRPSLPEKKNMNMTSPLKIIRPLGNLGDSELGISVIFGLGKLTLSCIGSCSFSITGGGFSPNKLGVIPGSFLGYGTIKMRWDFPARHHRSQGTRPPKLAILQGVPPLPVMGSHWGPLELGVTHVLFCGHLHPRNFWKVHGSRKSPEKLFGAPRNDIRKIIWTTEPFTIMASASSW